MKKLFIYASVAGFVTGTIYLLCKNKKIDNVALQPMDYKANFERKNQDKAPVSESDAEKEMYQVKNKCVQTVHDRHSEAVEIMTDAFNNILKEIEPVELEERIVDPVIDTKSVEVIKELDSLSDELDELLK